MECSLWMGTWLHWPTFPNWLKSMISNMITLHQSAPQVQCSALHWRVPRHRLFWKDWTWNRRSSRRQSSRYQLDSGEGAWRIHGWLHNWSKAPDWPFETTLQALLVFQLSGPEHRGKQHQGIPFPLVPSQTKRLCIRYSICLWTIPHSSAPCKQMFRTSAEVWLLTDSRSSETNRRIQFARFCWETQSWRREWLTSCWSRVSTWSDSRIQWSRKARLAFVSRSLLPTRSSTLISSSLLLPPSERS